MSQMAITKLGTVIPSVARDVRWLSSQVLWRMAARMPSPRPPRPRARSYAQEDIARSPDSPPTPSDYRRNLLTSLVTYTDWWSVLSPSQPGQCQAVTPILSADSASPRRYGFHMNPGVTK